MPSQQHHPFGFTSTGPGGASLPPYPAILTYPAKEALDLMNGFRQRRKTTNLPNTTITMLNKLMPRRVRDVNKYCYISDDTDQPFTIQELHMVLKTGKDTTPGADLITNSMCTRRERRGTRPSLTCPTTPWQKVPCPRAGKSQSWCPSLSLTVCIGRLSCYRV